MRQAQPLTQDRIALHIDDHATIEVMRPPALRLVERPERGYIAQLPVLHGDAVEMAAILRRAGRDEMGMPDRIEIRAAIDHRDIGETCIRRQQAGPDDGHVVDQAFSGKKRDPRREEGIEVARTIRMRGWQER